jgi:electron transfer flavoprotein beta subunit
MPAVIVGTQLLGEPRYPSLKGIMAARSKEVVTKSLADLGLEAATIGGAAARTKVTGTQKPPARGATQVVRGTAEEGAKAIADLLASRRLI